MALDYILNNTGPEVQECLDQVPVTQVQLTDEIANREAADSALRDSIGTETTRAEGAEQALDGRISAVEGKVPQDATLQNPLADKDWVAGSIATATADFITKSVNDLVNYYLKSETYTKAEVQQIIDSIKQFNCQSVPELPTASASTKGIIYLIPSADPQSENVKDEYITVYHTNEMGVTYYDWEQIGSTAIDLADYYTKSQTDAAITADLNTALASYSTTAQMNTAIETAIANLDLSDTYETKGAAAAVVGDAGEDYNTLAKIQGKLEPIEGEVGDKPYVEGSGNGMGRVVLKKGVAFADQFTQTNTIYAIQDDFDLDGGTLTIPSNSTLKFEGGSISKGTINFNGAKLENPKFVDCLYNGNVQVDALDDRHFTSTDDGNCLKWLLEQCLLLGIKLDVYRDYTFVMPSTSLAIIPQGVTVSNAVIDFHNHTITDTWAAERNGDIRGLILISGTVNGLTICNLNLIDQNNNTHLLAKSAGMCGLITKGECSGITLENIYQKYGDSIYRHGGYTVEQNLVINGVVNSKFCKLRVEDCGYSIAIYRGCNLDIDVEAIHPHRGLYLGAVDNSRIMYRGYYPEETHCHVLCQESVYYKDNTFTEWDMRGCSNLDINAEVMGVYSEQFYETILSFGTYGTGDDQEFVDRQSPTVHSNIKLTATVNGSNRVNSFIASSTSGNDSVVYLNNIELNGVDLSKSVNGILFNLPAGFVDVKLKDCINGSSIPIAVHGDASAFSARITSERTDLGTITAKVPLEMIMINCISGGEGSSSTAGMLKTYSYPIRIKNGGRYGGNQFVGTTENRPSPDREIVGSMYFDDTIKKPLWYIDYWKDGTHPGAWIESDRSRAGVSRVGTFADRPVSTASDTSGIPNIQPGFRYLCTDGYGEIIFKERSSGADIWLDANGNKAGVAKAGLITNRPLTTDITVGFIYINTLSFDISTVEYPIGAYCYIGSDTWISPDGKSVADGTMPARV